MAQLMDLIMQMVGGDATKQIGQQLGADAQTTQAGISAASARGSVRRHPD